MRRIVLVAIMASGLQGCAWGMRTVADFENVDMVSAEPLFEKANGWSAISSSTATIKHLRGNPRACDDEIAAYPEAADHSRIDRTIDDRCEPDSFLHLRNLAETADRKLNSPSPNSADIAEAGRLAKRYFDSGATLSDVLCSEWFDRLSRSSVAMAQSRDTLTNTSLAATGVMAAARTAAVTVSIVTAALGFGTKTANDLSNNYLLAPDLGELARKMKNYRATYRALITANPAIGKYAFATAELQNYHGTCSIAWARAYVNLAIKAAEASGGGSSSPATAADVGFQQLADILGASLSVPVNANDAKNYYALFFAKEIGNPNTSALKTNLTALISDVDKDGKPIPKLRSDGGVTNDSVAQALASFRTEWGGVLDPVAKTAGADLPAGATPAPAKDVAPGITQSPNVGGTTATPQQ